MDFLAIRKKAKERAEARARQEAAAREGGPPSGSAPATAIPDDRPAPPAPARFAAPIAPSPTAPARPGAGVAVPDPPASRAAEPPGTARLPPAPLEEELRDELSRLAGRGPPAGPSEAGAAPGEGPAAAAAGALDPLDEFFWREDEACPPIPDLGADVASLELPAAPAEARREYLSFLLGGEEYAVAVDRVREILRSPPITEVPRAPAHVVGVVTVRGDIVAVVDPRRRLALPPPPPGAAPRIIVCETADGPAGLLVDAVAQVVRLLPSSIEPRPAALAGTAGEAIAGIGRERDRLVILLDLDALLHSGAPAEAPA